MVEEFYWKKIIHFILALMAANSTTHPSLERVEIFSFAAQPKHKPGKLPQVI
jgi:hypothetical protein